jgi:hypothetical protein
MAICAAVVTILIFGHNIDSINSSKTFEGVAQIILVGYR